MKKVENTFKKYNNLIYKVIKDNEAIVNSCFSEKEDFYQELALSLIEAIKSYDPNGPASFMSYAYTCMYNKLIDVYRRETKVAKANKMLDDIYSFCEIDEGASLEYDFIDSLDLLENVSNSNKSRTYREGPVYLKERALGYDDHYICQKYGIKEGTLRSDISRIRNTIKEELV